VDEEKLKAIMATARWEDLGTYEEVYITSEQAEALVPAFYNFNHPAWTLLHSFALVRWTVDGVAWHTDYPCSDLCEDALKLGYAGMSVFCGLSPGSGISIATVQPPGVKFIPQGAELIDEEAFIPLVSEEGALSMFFYRANTLHCGPRGVVLRARLSDLSTGWHLHPGLPGAYNDNSWIGPYLADHPVPFLVEKEGKHALRMVNIALKF
jgi:hypothetical protein